MLFIIGDTNGIIVYMASFITLKCINNPNLMLYMLRHYDVVPSHKYNDVISRDVNVYF